jgi:hypothetical protein
LKSGEYHGVARGYAVNEYIACRILVRESDQLKDQEEDGWILRNKVVSNYDGWRRLRIVFNDGLCYKRR